MKFLVFIFSLYLLLLPCLPCGDEQECSAKKEASIANSHEQHDAEEEACTPFCVCSCCTASTFFWQTEEAKVESPVSGTTYNSIISSLPVSTINVVWQPPRIG